MRSALVFSILLLTFSFETLQAQINELRPIGRNAAENRAIDQLQANNKLGVDWNDPAQCAMPPGAESQIRKQLGHLRNQQNRGDCFANVAADLGTFATGRYLSAFHADVVFNTKYENKVNCSKTPYSNDGGDLGDAFSELQQHGVCEEKKAKSDAFNRMTLVELDSRLADIAKNIQNGNCTRDAAAALSQVLGISQRSANDLIVSAHAVSTDNFLLQLTDELCTDRVHPQSTVGYVRMDSNDPQSPISDLAVWNAIDELKAGRPSGVGMNIADMLTTSLETSYQNLKSQLSMKIAPTCEEKQALEGLKTEVANQMSAHALTIVGMDYNKRSHKCMIKLRNSWGDNGCNLKADGGCSNGVLEITADHLKKNVFAVLTSH